MANAWYNRGKYILSNSSMDFVNDTIKVLLLDNAQSYVFDPSHNFVADLTPGTNELTNNSGTGYERKTLATKAVNEDDVNDQAEMDCADIDYTSIDAGEIQAAVVYKEVTNDSDSPVIAYIDSGFPKQTNGGDLTLTINSEGLLQAK